MNFIKRFLCIVGKSLSFVSFYLLPPTAFISVLTPAAQGQIKLDQHGPPFIRAREVARCVREFHPRSGPGGMFC